MKRSERNRSMPARLLLAAALAAACHAALAQAQPVPPAVSVQRLAPQLVSFAGSEANFQSLVNGLANATQVQLFTVLPTGFVQNVSFTPTAALTPAQVAQTLETARQQLIGLGIGAPTAEQLAFALMGGVVPTALGGTQVPGALNPQASQTLPSAAAQIQGQASAGATAPTAIAPGTAGTGTSTTPGITNSVNVQTTPGITGTAGPTATVPRPGTSDSAIAAGATSRSAAPFTSASPTVNTSASPFATTPAAAPGAGSTPPAAAARLPGRPAAN
jgi:hypothetical protein